MKTLIDFPYEHVLVLGLAKSGTAAAKLLLASQINVRVNDFNTDESSTLITDLKNQGAEVILGSHPLAVLDGIDLIVKNPGISYDNIVLQEAVRRDIPIVTEIELAGKLVDGPLIGITGSNGKTTTTMLVGEMLARHNGGVKIAGNIGIVATDVAREINEDEKMVVELSSFQLMGIETFKPNVAVLLNVYEAHLDYHKTLAQYQQAKFKVFMNQTAEDYLVYNADNNVVVNGVKQAKSKLIPFSVTKQLSDGAWIDESSLYFKEEKVIAKQDIVLVGNHNIENILAAISVAKLYGVTNENIYEVLSTFTGVKHRLQYVGEINERLFYNDSKATNLLATQRALASFKQPIILLAGGLDRGNGFAELIPFLDHVKGMVVFGETAPKLKQLAIEQNIQVITVTDINEAVGEAYSLSEPDDVILLSPACASWDQYRTFEERGDMFIRRVHTLL